MNDRHSGRLGKAANPPADFKAVNVGQVDVENGKIDFTLRQLHRNGARRGFQDAITDALQHPRRGIKRCQVVVDYQHRKGLA